MDRVLVDTNIVLDLLSKREEFYKEAQELITLSDQGKVKLLISSLTIANAHYILSRHYKSDDARKILLKFKVLVEVLPLNDRVLELALISDFKDFEDAIQFYSALESDADLIITRNKKDFRTATLPVLTAKEYIRKAN